MKIIQNQTEIIVKNGTYTNYNFGNGNKNNPAVFSINNLNDILITNYPGHNPVIQFDGSGGIIMNKVSRVEIKGLEIIGPNDDITKTQAINRLMTDFFVFHLVLCFLKLLNLMLIYFAMFMKPIKMKKV